MMKTLVRLKAITIDACDCVSVRFFLITLSILSILTRYNFKSVLKDLDYSTA